MEKKDQALLAAYRNVFRGPDGETVLADLARFCRAKESTFDANPSIHALKEGRREVWLRIETLVNLTDDEAIQLLKMRLGQK